MSAGEGEDEDNEISRRGAIIAGLGLAGAAGGTLWGVTEIYKGLWDYGDRNRRGKRHRDDDVTYDPEETYDGNPNGTTFTPSPTEDPLDTWEEALPGECSLSTDERHWLVSRVDMYDNLDGDDFFDYIGEEVRLYDQETELRMEVDEDYSGGEFELDKGYNIPDVC